MKSRRVGSAEIAVTVFKSLFGQSALPRGIPQTHASRWRLNRPPKVLGENEKRQSGGVYWHPCKASASPLSPERSRLAQILYPSGVWATKRLSISNQNAGHADRPLRAGYSPEHRHDSPPRRLPRRRGPYHRADRVPE